MSITGPITPSSSTTRQQSLGRAAARDRWKTLANLLGLDGNAKPVEISNALTNDVGRPRLWLEVTANSTDATGFSTFDYGIKLYYTLYYATEWAEMVGVKARNAPEAYNTATEMAGYAVNAASTTCGKIIGIKRVAISKQRYPVLDYLKVPDIEDEDDDYRFIFERQNDPKYYGVAD